METGIWKTVKIRTGEQSGVERAAMDFVRESCFRTRSSSRIVMNRLDGKRKRGIGDGDR